MITPRKGEIMKYLKDGNLFEVRKVDKEFVILRSLDGLSQILTGQKSFPFLFAGIPKNEFRKEYPV
jgi:hypothetical protein